MTAVFDKLFYLWLLLLPFSWLIAVLAGVTAPDKLLAPLLMIYGFIKLFSASGERANRLFVFIFITVAFIIVKHLSFIGASDLFWTLIINDVIKLGYFLIPLLCIDTIKKLSVSSWIVVFIALCGCFSVFFVSVGIMTLPIERFETSRVGYEGLRKAIGLFPSYGDLAQYIAFSTLLVIVAPGIKELKKNKWLKLSRYIVFVGVILGILGTQSRNVLLSLLLSLGVLWLIRKISSKKGSSKDVIVMGFAILFVAGASVIAVFVNEFINTLAGLGGATAAHTASDRLDQYAAAWEIMQLSPLMGVDAETYRLVGPLIEGIHNVWLRLMAHGGLFSVFCMAILMWYSFKGIRLAAKIPQKTDFSTVSTGYFAALMLSIMFYTGMGELFWALLGVASSIACVSPFVDRKPAVNETTVVDETSDIDHRYPRLR